MALCSVQFACLPGLCRGTSSGRATTSVWTQRRKRPPLLPFLEDLLRWVHQASGIQNPMLVQAASSGSWEQSHILVKEGETEKEKGFKPTLPLATGPVCPNLRFSKGKSL